MSDPFGYCLCPDGTHSVFLYHTGKKILENRKAPGEPVQMNLWTLFSILACTAVGSTVLFVLRRVVFPKTNIPITTNWIDELSLEHYRPMVRLLDGGDLEFLGSQPGIDPKFLRRFRRQRCRIFRGYLKQLNTDFACICMAIKVIMVQSELDRPDLACTLLRSQLLFAATMVSLRLRVVLYEVGIGRIEIAGLLRLFEGMRLELRVLVPASAVCGV
jgi:hypothetical protein